MPVSWDEFEPVDQSPSNSSVSWGDFEPVEPPKKEGFMSRNVWSPLKGAGQELAGGLGSIAKGLITLSGQNVNMPGGPQAEPFGPTPPRTLSPLQLYQQSVPAYKAINAGEAAVNKLIPVSKEAEAGLPTKIGRFAGGFAPLLLSGPMAPAVIGVQSFGSHIENDFEDAKKKGLSEEDAASQAMNKALASGALQAAVFKVLPTPLRKAGEKLIVDRIGGEGLKRFLAGRAALGAEGAALGTASQAGENVIEGKPIGQNVGPAALGMGLPNMLFPYGRTAKERQDTFTAIADKLKQPPAPGSPAEPFLPGMGLPAEMAQKLKMVPETETASRPVPGPSPEAEPFLAGMSHEELAARQAEADRLKAQVASHQPARPFSTGIVGEQTVARPLALPRDLMVKMARAGTIQARIEALNNQLGQVSNEADVAKIQDEMQGLQRELVPLNADVAQQRQAMGIDQRQFPEQKGPFVEPFTSQRGPVQPEVSETKRDVEQPQQVGARGVVRPDIKRLPRALQPGAVPSTPLKTAEQAARERALARTQAEEASKPVAARTVQQMYDEPQSPLIEELEPIARKRARNEPLTPSEQATLDKQVGMAKWAIDRRSQFLKENAPEAESVPEPEVAPKAKRETKAPAPAAELPEYKQGLVPQIQDRIGRILGSVLPKKRDLAPLFSDLQNMAAKLGIVIDEPSGPFNADAYRNAARKVAGELQKKYAQQGKEPQTGRIPSVVGEPVDTGPTGEAQAGITLGQGPRQEGPKGREVPLKGGVLSEEDIQSGWRNIKAGQWIGGFKHFFQKMGKARAGEPAPAREWAIAQDKAGGQKWHVLNAKGEAVGTFPDPVSAKEWVDKQGEPKAPEQPKPVEQWQKVASVTKGGKPHFWNKINPDTGKKEWSVVWNRTKSKWSVQDAKGKTVTSFESEEAAKDFVDKQTPKTGEEGAKPAAPDTIQSSPEERAALDDLEKRLAVPTGSYRENNDMTKKIGMSIRTTEGLDRVADLRNKADAEAKAARAAFESDRSKENQAKWMDAVMKRSHLREIIETATGSGSWPERPGQIIGNLGERPLDVRTHPEARDWLDKNAEKLDIKYTPPEEVGAKPSYEERAEHEARSRQPYGTETAHPMFNSILLRGGTVREGLALLANTSKEAGKLAKLMLERADEESLGVRMRTRPSQERSTYYTGRDEIVFRGDRDQVPVFEAIHEIAHALTARKIPEYLTTLSGPKYRGETYMRILDAAMGNEKTPPPVRRLIEVYLRAVEAYPDRERLTAFIGDRDAVHNMGMPYGMGDLDEFIAEAFSRKSFQELLDGMPGVTEKHTLWQSFVKAVREILNLPEKAHSMLQDVLQASADVISSKRPETEEMTGVKPAAPSGEAGPSGSMPADKYLEDRLTKPVTTFWERDLKPYLASVGQFGKSMADVTTKLFAPVSHANKADVDVMFESKGEKEKFMTQVAAALDHTRVLFDKMEPQEHINFIDRMKRGDKQATPELDQVAAIIRQWDDKLFDAAAQFKPNLNYLDNHLRVLWKVIPGSEEAKANLLKQGLSVEQIRSKRPWRGSQGFLRRSTLDDMTQGIQLGGVPVTTNPMEMFMLHAQDVMKFVSANRAFEGLKKTGAVEFVRKGQRPPEGYRQISDSIAKAYFRTKEGLLTSGGEWWANDGAARLINNFLSRDYIRQGTASHPELGGIGRGLLAIKNATTAVELGLSPFHAFFESNEVIGSSFGLGLSKIFSGKPEEGLRDVVSAVAAPKLVSKLGRAAIGYAKNPEQFKAHDPETYNWFKKNYPDAENLLDDLFLGGGQVSMHEDYRVRGLKGFREAVRTDNQIGAIVRAVPALNEALLKPLFETYIPRLKVGTFLREYSFELERRAGDLESGKLTRGELARQTWAFVEDRFGELNWDNLYWNRTFKTGMQLAFRSVTWKLGNLRGFGKAGRDIVQEGLAPFKAPIGKALSHFDLTRELGRDWMTEGSRAPRMTMPMAWLVGMSIITAIEASIISKGATGKYPWELSKDASELLRNLTFPRIDPVDESQRVSIPTYWKDAVHFFHSPSDYVQASSTGEIGRFVDVLRNRDFYGTEVFHPGDPLYKRAYDAMSHMVPLPFGLSSSIAAHRTGATGVRSLAGFAGFTKAPYYMSYSPAEQQAFEYIRNKMPIGARTREVFERGVNERIAVDAIRRHEMTVGEAVQKGLIKPNRVAVVGRRVGEPPLIHAIKSPSITPDEALNIFDKASESEKSRLDPIIRQKIHNSKVLENQEKAERIRMLEQMEAR